MKYRALMMAVVVSTALPAGDLLAQSAGDPVYDRTEQEPDGSVSVGKYLFVAKAVDWLSRHLQLSSKDKFSPELQDRMMREVFVISGLDDLKSGKITARQYQHNLAVRLGSVADPATNASLYGRTKFISTKDIQATITQMKNQKP